MTSVGADIAVVGFDDFPLADLLDPPITVVLQDVVGLGRTAAEMLFSRLDGDTSPTRRVIMPAVVAPRGSGEIPTAPLLSLTRARCVGAKVVHDREFTP